MKQVKQVKWCPTVMNQGEKFWRSPPHFQRRAALSEARELRWAGTTANILALFWKKKRFERLLTCAILFDRNGDRLHGECLIRIDKLKSLTGRLMMFNDAQLCVNCTFSTGKSLWARGSEPWNYGSSSAATVSTVCRNTFATAWT